MGDLGNIEKRIKRHVSGKVQSFFVTTPPGLEPLCFDELRTLGLSSGAETVVKGGIEIQGRIPACYRANLLLRTANRILMRVGAFGATNFRRLEKKLKNIPWEFYLKQGASCDIKVASRHSRLYHKEAIAGWFQESIVQRWGEANAGSAATQPEFPGVQQVFVRVLHDDFTVSIDSSGELLHKRGLKIQGARAPIRETIAAGILAICGYDGRQALLDPMCGAGTFSLEAAMVANHIPSGWYRSFAFMEWPCFSPSQWKHIRTEAESSMTRLTEPIIYASDKDRRTCQRLEKVVHDNDLSGSIAVFDMDFFDLQPAKLLGPEKAKDGLVVINPPYGRRLEDEQKSATLFLEICRKLKKDFKNWKVALIVPHNHLVSKIPFKTVPRSLFHGGLHMTLVTGRIRVP